MHDDDERHPGVERRRQLSGPAKISIPITVALSIGIFVATQIYDLFGRLPIDVSNNARDIASLREQCELRYAACVERDRVQSVAIERNSAKIDALAKQPDARPDPFTGTEGRELERRIDALERRP